MFMGQLYSQGKMLEYEMLPSPDSPRLSTWDKLGKLTLGKLTNDNIMLGKLTWVYLPKISLLNLFYPGKIPG